MRDFPLSTENKNLKTEVLEKILANFHALSLTFTFLNVREGVRLHKNYFDWFVSLINYRSQNVKNDPITTSIFKRRVPIQ